MLSLLLDGVTGGIQDKLRAEHVTQTHRMMLSMNLWSILYLSFGKTTAVYFGYSYWHLTAPCGLRSFAPRFLA